MPSTDSHTTLACKKDTLRDLRRLKRGGENYDELLRKMICQYDPEQALSHGE